MGINVVQGARVPNGALQELEQTSCTNPIRSESDRIEWRTTFANVVFA